MSRPTHVYVVLSPRPRVGKTLMARVFTEFYRSEGRPVAAYDLDPAEGTLSEFLPGFAIASQIADTRGQMALFDRLIVDDEKPKVIDVGSGLFSHFLKVMTEIDFVPRGAAALGRAHHHVHYRAGPAGGGRLRPNSCGGFPT